MSTQTEQYPLQSDLHLTERDAQSLLTIRTVSLVLNKQDDALIECRLTFQVEHEYYQHIETEALFNLKPEIRNPLPTDTFLPEPNIAIEVSLKPDLLHLLAEHTAAIDQVAAHLLTLNQSHPESPLFSTENWLALSVKQQQPSGEIGYRTLWSYVSPDALAQAVTGSSHKVSEGIVNFFKDWAETNLTATTPTIANQALDSMTGFLEQFSNLDLDQLLERLPNSFTELTHVSNNLLETIIHFFTTDDWTFTKLQGQAVLQMVYQGKNGNWICYAHARDTQEQFIFYSICPIAAPEDKRQAIAHFLTLANYGLLIGNFELDFSDGEIRYKTSIDVEGDQLSSALIKTLVYTNVTMMDEYLSGIKAIIETGISPEEAIGAIELVGTDISVEG
jgi:hypothetical protein